MSNVNNVKDQKKILREQRVAFFPSVKALSGNPYWPILATELEKVGICIEYDAPASFNFRWLLENRRRIKILNIHFVQQFYKSSSVVKKLIKLLMFGFNMQVARLFGYRTVFTLHNLEPTYPLKPAWLDYLGHWMVANASERVIVYCYKARRLLKEKYGRSKGVYYVDHPNVIQYYPNTVSKETAREQLNLPTNSLVFAFIGGVRPNKGVEVLIQAFLSFKPKDDHYRLVIAGNIFPPKEYAKSLQKMAIEDERISFYLRFIPDDELQVFMNASDIIVLPFSKILTSGTANLAMSFARPVIVPKMGCLPELVETDFGWLFEADDANSLAESMRIAANCDFEHIGQKAFEKVSRYSPERFAMQTMKVYCE